MGSKNLVATLITKEKQNLLQALFAFRFARVPSRKSQHREWVGCGGFPKQTFPPTCSLGEITTQLFLSLPPTVPCPTLLHSVLCTGNRLPPSQVPNTALSLSITSWNLLFQEGSYGNLGYLLDLVFLNLGFCLVCLGSLLRSTSWLLCQNIV